MSDHWYLNPLKWVDDDDLFDVTGALTMHRAIDVLKDKLVHRPADEATMTRGLMRSAKAHGLTRKQQSAVDLAREAMVAGQTATLYVAEKLNINRFSAYKLLKRADAKIQPKMETFAPKFDIYSKARVKIAESDIQRVLAGMKVDCAGCGEKPAPARTCLCYGCLKKYGMDGERPAITAGWLDKMIRITRHDARKRAIDRLMVTDGVIEMGA